MNPSKFHQTAIAKYQTINHINNHSQCELQKMSNELIDLVKDGNIGFYTSCEIIEIFGYEKDTNTAFNIFTIAVFEYSKRENKESLITNKLQDFSPKKPFKWGICKRRITKQEAIKLFNSIEKENKYNAGEKELQIDALEKIEKAYVPPDSSLVEQTPINDLLKSNHNCGSYIVEFFNFKKEKVKFILNDPVCMNNLSEGISNLIPIKIGTISDRIGNILFQIPINKYKIKTHSSKKTEGLRIEFIPHANYKKIPEAKVKLKSLDDNLLLDQSIKDIKGDDDVPISLKKIVFCEIFDKNELIIYQQKLFFKQEINISSGVCSPQKRFFSKSGTMIEIDIESNISYSIPHRSKTKIDWTANRKYEQELKVLEHQKAFLQYYGEDDDHEKALRDIRKLINIYGSSGVYLWDPYLSSEDIKQTLYYCKYSNAEIRAITGLKQGKNKEDTIKNMTDDFNQDVKNYLFLNIEVRGKHKGHGYDFHDRFLIFPRNQPKVWSLGISVNQLGKSHHILQEVRNSQHITNAFNSLWQDLNHQECIIWKSM